MAAHLHKLQRILILVILTDETFSQSPCKDWEIYKDEKCIKIFNTPGVLDYPDAETLCSEQSANLMSIGTRDKQTFIENFLQSNGVSDNVWMGLKYSDNNGYQWSDGTRFYFTNWAAGNPKNDSSYCVQFHTEEEEFGKWSEVVCSRKNLILCEKVQLWSSSKLQTIVMNLVMNPVPPGFIYVQLPKEKLPSEIWPSLIWEDVTKEYAGVFFRAEGGNSSSFGQIQEENSPRLVNVKYSFNDDDNYDKFLRNVDLNANNQQTGYIRTGVYEFGEYNAETGLSFRVSSGEVRPRNMAVRVWRRVD